MSVEIVATVAGDDLRRHLEWNPQASAFKHDVGAGLMAVAEHERITAQMADEISELRHSLGLSHAAYEQCARKLAAQPAVPLHTPRRRASGEYECSCGAVWDADEGSECPND